MFIITQNLEKQKGRKFLEHFKANNRGPVMNLFLFAARNGCRTPEEILLYVQERAGEYAGGQYSVLPQLVRENPEQALALARYALTWETLPDNVKTGIKDARAKEYRAEYMKKQPPTEKQLKYLRSLGYGEEVLNRWEAAQLIERLKK